MCDLRETFWSMGVATMSSQSSQHNPCAKRPGDWGFEPPKVCGCHSSKICKHYYGNMLAAILADADRHTTEETAGDLLGDPSHQTYFHVWRGTLITLDNDPRNWKHMHRRAQRL
jgi:hypothetical protein